MKKIVALLTAVVMVMAMFIILAFAEDITIDFNTEEGRAKGTFFGSECEFKEDAGTEGKTVAYLVNKNNGQDATADNGGIYNNGIIVSFDAAKASTAEVTLTLICPDHINGAAGYKLHYLFGGDPANIKMADLSSVEDHSFFTYTITGDVVKGTNQLYLVQGVGGGNGNGWRIDVAKLDIKLTAKEAEPALKVSEDGLTKSVNFNSLDTTDRVKGAVKAADIGAIDIDDNYQIGVNDNQNVLMTIDGYNPAWIIYKMEAPEGKVLDSLKLTITGRIYDFAPNANAFAVFAKNEPFSGSGADCEFNTIEAQNRGADDWEDYCVYHAQANVADAKGVFGQEHGIDTVQNLDLTDVAKDQSVVYVAIFQLTTGSPEWIEYKNLTLAATAKDSAPAPQGSYTYKNASFDSFITDGIINFGEADGNASGVLDTVDRIADNTEGIIKNITLRGWIGFEEEIDQFGYRLNGKNIFGDFAAATEDAVKGAGGQNALRFAISIDTAGLKGDNKIVAIVKLANGEIVALDETLEATGPATPPNTSFTLKGPAPDPEENAKTGDASIAMIAVIAVLAMGAAMVFMKKKSF